MNISTVIATVSVAVIVFLAIRYIVKEKLKGSKCVGCPYAESCHGGKNEEAIEAIVGECRSSAREH